LLQYVLVVWHPPIWLALPLGMLAGFGGWPLLMWITLFAPGWRAVRPGELDEREVAERYRSFVLSYSIAGVCLGGVLLVAQLAQRMAWPLVTAGVKLSDLVFGLLWAFMALPGIVIAWRSGLAERRAEAQDRNVEGA
jgi:hypothetical protein